MLKEKHRCQTNQMSVRSPVAEQTKSNSWLKFKDVRSFETESKDQCTEFLLSRIGPKPVISKSELSEQVIKNLHLSLSILLSLVYCGLLAKSSTLQDELDIVVGQQVEHLVTLENEIEKKSGGII